MDQAVLQYLREVDAYLQEVAAWAKDRDKDRMILPAYDKPTPTTPPTLPDALR